MFIDQSYRIIDNPKQLNYGIAVTDIDHDGQFEVVVAGFGFPNLVLKWNGEAFQDIAPPELADPTRQAIGVAACDIDGDGTEEIYMLNTDTFGGLKRRGDRLFDPIDDEWVDLFSLYSNHHALNLVAGRSVISVDRTGNGYYGFFVASYGGPMRFYELNDDGMLQDIAPQLGLDLITGGRSLVALPLVSHQMDILAGNEQGPNFLFKNLGNGAYKEIAQACGVHDPFAHARGLAILDGDNNDLFDIVCGNWEGRHRYFVQVAPGKFEDQMPTALGRASRNRNVIVADFDNDGYEEVFFNNIGEPNRLMNLRANLQLDIGDALEPTGLGTGAAIGDFNGDGCLELFISHGESSMQPLAYYRVRPNDHHWLRILPLTRQGAPARGAVVILLSEGRLQKRVIDSGSGYLCQMEPVAHFGLGEFDQVDWVQVRWLDGTVKRVDAPNVDQMMTVPHPQAIMTLD